VQWIYAGPSSSSVSGAQFTRRRSDSSAHATPDPLPSMQALGQGRPAGGSVSDGMRGTSRADQQGGSRTRARTWSRGENRTLCSVVTRRCVRRSPAGEKPAPDFPNEPPAGRRRPSARRPRRRQGRGAPYRSWPACRNARSAQLREEAAGRGAGAALRARGSPLHLAGDGGDLTGTYRRLTAACRGGTRRQKGQSSQHKSVEGRGREGPPECWRRS